MKAERSGTTVRLTWPDGQDAATLASALQDACVDAFNAGVHRVEARVVASEVDARRALHRTGFRLEGTLRASRSLPDGSAADELLYAVLSTDERAGRVGHTSVMNTVTPRKRLIAHALVLDAAGHVLLCETTFKPDWELPGGIVEPGESPAAALGREMVEEMGWAPSVGGLLVADWLRPYLGWEDALELVFATAVVTEAERERLVADGHEVRALHWVAAERLGDHMTPFGADRARTALRALAEGRTWYAEAGRPLSGHP